MTIEEMLGIKPQRKNRAQRRREAKEEEKGVWMTEKELRQLSAHDTQDAYDQITDLVIFAALMVLHREFGFGHVRAGRFLDLFEDYLGPVIEGDFPARTIEEQVFDELQISVKIGKKKRPWRKWR